MVQASLLTEIPSVGLSELTSNTFPNLAPADPAHMISTIQLFPVYIAGKSTCIIRKRERHMHSPPLNHHPSWHTHISKLVVSDPASGGVSTSAANKEQKGCLAMSNIILGSITKIGDRFPCLISGNTDLP